MKGQFLDRAIWLFSCVFAVLVVVVGIVVAFDRVFAHEWSSVIAIIFVFGVIAFTGLLLILVRGMRKLVRRK